MHKTLRTLLWALALMTVWGPLLAQESTIDYGAPHEAPDTSANEGIMLISEDLSHEEQVITRAHEHELTIYSTREDALTDQYLTREQAAKVMTKFLQLYDPHRPSTLMMCIYDDIDSVTEDLQGYISSICNLRFMDIEGESFKPYDAVSQEEFKSMLRHIMSQEDKHLVDQVIRNKALLPHLERGVVFSYLYELYNLTQDTTQDL